MGAIVLQLKKRTVKDSISIPSGVYQTIRGFLEKGDRDALWNMFAGLKDTKQTIHDKQWLEIICAYGEKEGTSMRSWAPWLGLRSRVDRLDDTREGPFTLSAVQASLIWDRLRDPKFTLQGGLSPQLAEFVMEFCQATGYHFEDTSDEAWASPTVDLPASAVIVER